ncbi:nuclear transport factor 2 family protein [Streptomyces olivaceoviridis]|uniref:nuclear transport factor 2 family protein n=1 Tax=Streptomyces olivaceoviridis TaxID=1921 RepID=UPI00370050A6
MPGTFDSLGRAGPPEPTCRVSLSTRSGEGRRLRGRGLRHHHRRRARRDNVKKWIRGFLDQVDGLRLEVIETFQNQDGSRVASRRRVHGRNNGVLGTEADGRPNSFTGTAVWTVREDGKLLHNWVERASWELGAGSCTSASRRRPPRRTDTVGPTGHSPPARTVGAPCQGRAVCS